MPYDSIGNLIKDNAEGITSISWTVYGKISRIIKSDGTNISYTYDPSGNRISKTVIKSPPADTVTTWYVRDAQGNVMTVYTAGNDSINDGHLSQTELHLYGSSRLGILRSSTDVADSDLSVSNDTTMPLLDKGYTFTFARGNKLFELSNHLGNVLVTLNDTKIGVSSNDSTVDYFNPQVVSAQDYYPFGMLQVGRSYNVSGYRYGFNGKENDNEVKGEGGQQDYGMRVYDTRLGKFLSVDPLQKKYPWYTPYQFAGNSPISYTDLDGLERNYYIFTSNASKIEPVLQYVVSQTHEAGFWNGLKDDLTQQYINSTPNYKRKTEYNGDLITDCSDIYVLQQGTVFREFPSMEALKKAVYDDISEAQARVSEDIVNRVFLGELSFQYFTHRSEFSEAMEREGDPDPFSDDPFSEHVPESNNKFPRLNGSAKVTASEKITVSGKPVDVGLGQLKDGVLTMAVYMKDANGNYYCKKGTITGQDVYDEIIKQIKTNGGRINTILGVWGGDSDNLTAFNKLVKEGMSPNKAATQTFSGVQAGLKGYTNAHVDMDKSKVNDDGTFKNVVVEFNK